MSLKRIIQTNLAPQPIGPYSQAVCSGNQIYVSGQLGLDLMSYELPEDFPTQVKNCLYNIKSIVEAAGSRMDRVLKVTVFLSNLDNFAEFNQIYRDFFEAQPPAREVVEVSRLPKDALIEISAIAFLQDSIS